MAFTKPFFSAIRILLISIVLACSKQDSPKKTNSELLTQTKWQLEKLLYEQPPGSSQIDVTNAVFQPCELDDIFNFMPNGEFISSDNNIICSRSGNSVFIAVNGGSWNLSKTDTLVIGKGFITQLFRLSSINSTHMELNQTFKDYFQQDISYVFQLKAVP